MRVELDDSTTSETLLPNDVVLVDGRAGWVVSRIFGFSVLGIAVVGSLALLVFMGPMTLELVADTGASGLLTLALPLMLCGVIGYAGFRLLPKSQADIPAESGPRAQQAPRPDAPDSSARLRR